MEPRVAVGPPPDDDRGKPAVVPIASSFAADLRLVPSGNGFLLKQPFTTFGRADGNDIVLLSPNASRFHGRFVIDDGDCFLEDFNSWNGLFVNGQPAGERRRLAPHDLIDVGDVRFVYRR